MQKLTNDKARELLKELQYAKVQMGSLSIKDEYFKQALERVPQWIACTERMPNEDGTYLCVYDDGDGAIVLACGTSVEFSDWYFEDSSVTYASGKITHWMPLPETP